MKKKIILCIAAALLISTTPAFSYLIEKEDVHRIENIGMNLLVKNNINKRITFGFTDLKDFSAFPSSIEPDIYKDYNLHNNREVTIPINIYPKLTSDDEVAAIMAHEIAQGIHSYKGIMNGQIMISKNGTFPLNYWAKKNELQFDRDAVDYLAGAGYNPVALITAYSKTLPEVRGTFFLRHNKAAKRINNIYNYIKTNYPKYLENNRFTSSVYYKRYISNL